MTAWFPLASMSAPRIEAQPVLLEAAPVAAELDLPPPAPPVPTVQDMMADGVVIVVSKPSQRMFVFRDGELWKESPVSTGKKGHTTPSGVFAILQKRVKHRSNIYSNAPMPFMQRLTWSGIALHAGHLPGYPASHGCIRLPRAFAASLYQLTKFGSTAVIVTDAPLIRSSAAATLAGLVDSPVPDDGTLPGAEPVRLAAAAMERMPSALAAQAAAPERAGPVRRGGGQTIQLAAATSPGEATAHWSRLVRARPDLAGLDRTIEPATVNSKRYYRLRVTAPGAHALCGTLKRSGIDCFAVS
ncbi:L,D-transpeptidase family protein [Tsuneonella amylolytica]|uniref:L,D-transpeptidase family protein n=1 Tax=Tsuneonella amylolytica TaxID=2338327 RepID=UPI000EA9E3A4|nr:L,D-transpeptidase family protein [Tsuneonella amylolytica]